MDYYNIDLEKYKNNFPFLIGYKEILQITLSILEADLRYSKSEKERKSLEKRVVEVEGVFISVNVLIEKNKFPIHSESESLRSYSGTILQLNQIRSERELRDWIVNDWPNGKMSLIKSLMNDLKGNSRIMAGNWNGYFQSHNEEFRPGEFASGIIQIGNKLIGKGTLIGSMYLDHFIYGLIVGNDIRVNFFSPEMEVETIFHGWVSESEGKISIPGKYWVEDCSDRGNINSQIQEIIQLSPNIELLKTVILVQDSIGTGEVQNVIDSLDSIRKINNEYSNEIVMHIAKLNTLERNKRIGITSLNIYECKRNEYFIFILELLSKIKFNCRIK